MENKKSVSTRGVEERMVVLRNQAVIADADVAYYTGSIQRKSTKLYVIIGISFRMTMSLS